MKYISKTLILSVFIHVNNFILSQLRQPPTTNVYMSVCFQVCIIVAAVNSEKEQKYSIKHYHSNLNFLLLDLEFDFQVTLLAF